MMKKHYWKSLDIVYIRPQMESCDKCIDYRWIQSSVQKYDLCIFNDLGTAKLEYLIGDLSCET
jgi:hypothetical protein